jgi:hypothetical protein
MSTHPANDIEIYHAINLATFVPRTIRGRDWIMQKLKPEGWQSGHQGAYYTSSTEVDNLRAWMHRDGLVTEIINPG